MISPKSLLVYRLFCPPFPEAELPKEEDFYSWDELEKLRVEKGSPDNGRNLFIWVKNKAGHIFKAVCYKNGLMCYENGSPVGEGITHIAKLKEKKDEKPS